MGLDSSINAIRFQIYLNVPRYVRIILILTVIVYTILGKTVMRYVVKLVVLPVKKKHKRVAR